MERKTEGTYVENNEEGIKRGKKNNEDKRENILQ